MPSSSLLLKLVDRCVPSGYLEMDIYDIILRSRVTVIFLALSTLASFYVGYLVGRVDPTGAGQTGLFMLGIAYMAISVIFHFTGAFFVVANLYAAVCYVSIYLSSFSFGGPTENPLVSLMLMVPLITFIIAGKLTALFWTLFSIVGFVITANHPELLPAFGHSVLLRPDQLELLNVLAWVALSMGLFSMLYAYDLMNDRLRHVISEERNHFAYEAGHDKLTGLLNRASFQQRLAASVDRVRVNKVPAIVGLIDLDGFKPVNDQIGHHAGDTVLRVVSSKLQQGMRTTDTLARLGGDEFAFILPDLVERGEVDARIQAMLDAIAEPIMIDGQHVRISGSIGLARCPLDKSEAYDVLRAADVAMYEAKNGKGRFCYFHELPLDKQSGGS